MTSSATLSLHLWQWFKERIQKVKNMNMVGTAEAQNMADLTRRMWRWDQDGHPRGQLQLKLFSSLNKRETSHLLVEDCPLRMWGCVYKYLI